MLTEALVLAFFVIGIQLMVPIVMAALGEAIAEKSGVLNVGIEGVMLIGAFATAYHGDHPRPAPWLGILAAVVAGLVFGAVLAFLTSAAAPTRSSPGLMFNIFAVGLTGDAPLAVPRRAERPDSDRHRSFPASDRHPVGRRDPRQAEPHALSGDPVAFGVWLPAQPDLVRAVRPSRRRTSAGRRVGRAGRRATPLPGRSSSVVPWPPSAARPWSSAPRAASCRA